MESPPIGDLIHRESNRWGPHPWRVKPSGTSFMESPTIGDLIHGELTHRRPHPWRVHPSGNSCIEISPIIGPAHRKSQPSWAPQSPDIGSATYRELDHCRLTHSEATHRGPRSLKIRASKASRTENQAIGTPPRKSSPIGGPTHRSSFDPIIIMKPRASAVLISSSLGDVDGQGCFHAAM